MANNQNNHSKIFQVLVNNLTSLPLWEIGNRLVGVVKRIWQAYSLTGIYEVLEYESTLELKDIHGKQASFSKREKVRYLQNNVIAYQDQAWGDGDILSNYRCTPGKAVDFYRPGHKTYVVISIQNVRNFGDGDEYLIEWGMKDCFLRSKELWETSVNHPTRSLSINIIFPRKRPPLRVNLIEDTRQKATLLVGEHMIRLPDGRWQIHWETNQVRQHERYILQWEW